MPEADTLLPEDPIVCSVLKTRGVAAQRNTLKYTRPCAKQVIALGVAIEIAFQSTTYRHMKQFVVAPGQLVDLLRTA